MRFGQSTAEAEAEPARSSGDGAYIKYLKKGDNEIQIVDEYNKWVWYWEHYNPGGYPFPCTRDRKTCPGCTSENEKMKSASYRAAFNAYDGQYTNVWKVPKTVAESLKNRYDRTGTITDRPYIITQLKNAEGRYTYDIEGQEKRALDMSEIGKYTRDPEELLAAAYEQSWGSPDQAQATRDKALQAEASASLQQKLAEERGRAAVAEQQKKDAEIPEGAGEQWKAEAKAEEHEYSEAELRKMAPQELRDLCVKEGLPEPPEDLMTSDRIVDWMITATS